MDKKYICAGESYNARYNHVSAPIFRKKFDYPDLEKKAKIEIAVCGIYRLFINGHEVTKGYFAPYFSNPEQVVYYDEYCVSDLLKKKDNIICILLGNGFNNAIDCGIWDFEKASFRSAPKFYLRLYNDLENVIESDETFQVSDSPIMFDDVRCGEIYDAQKNFDVISENVQNSKSAVLAQSPVGIYRKCEAESIKKFGEIEPLRIIQSKNGYIYDFGVNTAGVFQLKVNGRKGQKIDFYCAEALRDGELLMDTVGFIDRWDARYVQQHDIYYCKDGIQSYTPSFTYHGFRYILVEGITSEQATKELLKALVLHSDVKESGFFKCGNEIINKIQECVIRSDFANLFYFPTDCPHREKNGWTDDASFSAEQMNYNLSVYNTLREWLYNVRLSQQDCGKLPGIIPTTGWGYEWGNGPESDMVIVNLPYQLYRFSGKKEIIEENIYAITKYLAYAKTKINADGLFCYGIGDWCEAGAKNEFSMSTPVEVCDSLIVMQIFILASKLYQAINDKNAENAAVKYYEFLRGNFRKKYTREEGWISCKTQTGQAMGIAIGVFEEKEIKSAYENLKKLIFENDKKMKVGVVGCSYLYNVLSQNGDIDLALEMITDTKWPSYGYLIEVGATSLWEMFQHVDDIEDFKPYDCDGRALSLNHHFWGSISAWFYRELAGINIITSQKVEISPKIPKHIDYAEAKVELGNKSVEVRWEKDENTLRLTINNRGMSGEIKVEGYELVDEVPEIIEGNRTYILKSKA